MNAELHSRSGLSSRLVRDMFALISEHFEGVTHDQFLADLDAKNWVILVRDPDGILRGFSTLDFRITNFKGTTESVLYSGDTIMDPEAWNSSILARSFLEAALHLHDRFGEGTLWWLLITSGFRTYRFLPVFMREFYPRHDSDTPVEIQERLTSLARERFGARFDPASGVVRFSNPQRLRSHLNGIPGHRLRNRHVAFFDSLNPHHAEGDELVSLCRLEPSNLSSAGLRMLQSFRSEPVLAVPSA